MKEIKLTRGFVALVDDEDFEKVSKFKWYAQKPNKTTHYAVRTVWTGDRKKPGRMYMHRFILDVSTVTILIDHKDGDGLNNQKENLRKTDKSGNGCNRGATRHKLYSKYKGVSFRKDTNKFVAHIAINGKTRSLGCFVLAEDAAKAYDIAARKVQGEFARLNFRQNKNV